MNAQERNVNWRRAFEGKKVLPAEEVLKYIARAESEGDFQDLIDLVCKVDDSYLTGNAEKQNELRQKIIDIKKRFIESHPEELKIMKNGLVWSVCCDELKEAVLKGEIESMVDIDSGTGMLVRSPEIMAKMQNTENKDYPKDYAIATGQCPFCGADLYDRTVNMDGIDPEDFREQ